MTNKARILFVDDEKRVLNSMRGLFRRQYELFLTCEGSEAIRIAAENDIDVIVADQRMPGMTGIEVLAKMKEQSPRTVRILLTGYADPSAVEGSINEGEVFRFLSKPCPPNVLRETLNLAISASQTAPVEPANDSSAEPVAPTTPEPAAPAARPEPEPEPAVASPQPAPAADPPWPRIPKELPLKEIEPAAEIPAPEVTSETTSQADVTGEQPVPSIPMPPEIGDDDETQPALLALSEEELEQHAEPESHWQTVTNVVMSEDSVEETSENVALTEANKSLNDVGVVVFTVDSEFATTAIRAVSDERTTILATTLVKVAQAISENHIGVLVTDYTTNNTILQKIISTLKKHVPDLVTIVVSDGRDTTDMISLINYGQVFRYVLKPIEAGKLRREINAAVVRHLYIANNPESAIRHQVEDAPKTGESSESLNTFMGKVADIKRQRRDPTDTIS